jgi:hypothetical protein
MHEHGEPQPRDRLVITPRQHRRPVAATRSGHTPQGSPSLPPLASRPASRDRASTTTRARLPTPQDRTVGRNRGHLWGETMAASGEIHWPPMGSFPWPPSTALAEAECEQCPSRTTPRTAVRGAPQARAGRPDLDSPRRCCRRRQAAGAPPREALSIRGGGRQETRWPSCPVQLGRSTAVASLVLANTRSLAAPTSGSAFVTPQASSGRSTPRGCTRVETPRSVRLAYREIRRAGYLRRWNFSSRGRQPPRPPTR